MIDSAISRCEFVLLFEVINGNPNGDPDSNNMPRMDPETGHGLVTDVCLKRKIRNYIDFAKSNEAGKSIYVKEGIALNQQNRLAYAAIRGERSILERDGKLLPDSDIEARSLKLFMCKNFFDIRAFGAVMTTGVNCGQVRGPVQLSFARSIEPIMPAEVAITRVTRTNLIERSHQQRDRAPHTLVRKVIIPYALYRVHGFVSAMLARQTGFSAEDLSLLWEAIENMFDHDRSASRGELNLRKFFVFEHESPLGCAPAHVLFDAIRVSRNILEVDPRDLAPARTFADYTVSVDAARIPANVSLKVRV